ncbi:MAG TPA: hypothetical protein VK835_02635, partial [Bacteroidia bacterium]|nr:hypothetical protein [Bacteroidia bacterium]
PLCDYIMQSLFIKMTGFQEQKLKCICWELATFDYEYRYKTEPLKERSNYSDKQSIYKDLVAQIKKRSTKFNMPNGINKAQILTKTTKTINLIFDNTNLSKWSQKSFNEYGVIWSEIKEKHFANDNANLFTAGNEKEISLQKIYIDFLYRHRNRIAHNTQSYQQNLPTLKTLANPNFRYENYFIWFSILILIDEIFIELYGKYLNTFDE